jgi:DNA-binding response OmpR family regulator
VTDTAVLIVDDHPVNAAHSYAVVTDCGHKADISLSITEAVEMAQRRGYWLAIVNLDIGDGFELVTRLRAQDRRVAIIAMTASASVDTSLRALEAGASIALVKPVAPRELCERMTRLLERRAADLKLERLRRDIDEHLRRNRG